MKKIEVNGLVAFVGEITSAPAACTILGRIDLTPTPAPMKEIYTLEDALVRINARVAERKAKRERAELLATPSHCTPIADQLQRAKEIEKLRKMSMPKQPARPMSAEAQAKLNAQIASAKAKKAQQASQGALGNKKGK